METVRRFYLVRGMQLFVLHISQHVVSIMQRPHLWVASADICGQADEPQAVTMPEQTLGPHLWDGGVRLSHPLGWFDLLQREDRRGWGIREEGERFDKRHHGVWFGWDYCWKFQPVGNAWKWQLGWWDWCVSRLMLLWGFWDHPEAHRVGCPVPETHCSCKISKVHAKLVLVVIVKPRHLFIKSTMLQHAALTAGNRCSFCSFREDYYKDRIADLKRLK